MVTRFFHIVPVENICKKKRDTRLAAFLRFSFTKRMLPLLATVFLFSLLVKSSISNYEPFNVANPLSHIENNIAPLESSNRKSFQSNRVIECDMEDIFNIVGLNEVQELIESLAVRKGTTPFAIVKLLQKRMKNKEEMEETMSNAIDRIPIPEIISPSRIEISNPVRIPPLPNEAIYSVPSQATNTHDDKTDVVIIQSQNRLPNRLPPVLKADFLRKEEPRIFGNAGASVGRIHQVMPGMFPLPPVKNNQFAATVRVNSNDPVSSLKRDIIITVSPLMTLIEALRQAEIKYQNILDLSHETDVFTFSHSPIMDCYMISQINGVLNNEEYAWQVTISDRDNQVVYSNFCLPSGRDAFVKPGTLISLSYVPL